MRAKATMSPPSRGIAPPERPVPAPRPTNGTPNSWASFTSAATSSVVRGKTTRSGRVLIDAAVVLVERKILVAIQVAARSKQGSNPFFQGR